ncbi:MAG: hypothetical protein DYG93_07040 [Leptolyngbya sp. PLA2]|nr:hypothetical protein [Leptolyngbya sp. PL-A2]
MKKAIAVLAVLAVSGAAFGNTIIHNKLQGPGYAWSSGFGSSSGGQNLFGGYNDYAVVDKVSVPLGFNAITEIKTTSISAANFFFGAAPILATQASVYVTQNLGSGAPTLTNVGVASVNIGVDGYGIAMVQMTWTGNIPVTGGQDYYIGLRAFSTAGEPNEWYYQHDAPGGGSAHQSGFAGPRRPRRPRRRPSSSLIAATASCGSSDPSATPVSRPGSFFSP